MLILVGGLCCVYGAICAFFSLAAVLVLIAGGFPMALGAMFWTCLTWLAFMSVRELFERSLKRPYTIAAVLGFAVAGGFWGVSYAAGEPGLSRYRPFVGAFCLSPLVFLLSLFMGRPAKPAAEPSSPAARQ